VRFRPSTGRGTEVLVELSYKPPAGRVGALVAKLFREEPGQQVQQDLHQFKQIMEIGEVLLSNSTIKRGAQAARPHDDDAASPKVQGNRANGARAVQAASQAMPGSNVGAGGNSEFRPSM
jgi:hypothetical protein